MYTLGGASIAKSLSAALVRVKNSGVATVLVDSTSGTNQAAYVNVSNTYGGCYFGLDGSGLNGFVNRAVIQTTSAATPISLFPGGAGTASFSNTGTTLTGTLGVTGASTLTGNLTQSGGNISFSSGGTFQSVNTYAGGGFYLANFLAPSALAGNIQFDIGVATSAYNAAQIIFNYVAAGSHANTVSLGLDGAVGQRLQIDGDNLVTVKNLSFANAGAINGTNLTVNGTNANFANVTVSNTFTATLFMNGSNNVTPNSGTWSPIMKLLNSSVVSSLNSYSASTAFGTWVQIGGFTTYYFDMTFSYGNNVSGNLAMLQNTGSAGPAFSNNAAFSGSTNSQYSSLNGAANNIAMGFSTFTNVVLFFTNIGNPVNIINSGASGQRIGGAFTMSA